MKLCYLTSDFDAPGSYRCLFPGRQLARRGHSVTMPPYVEHENEQGRLLVEYRVNVTPPTPWADIWVLQQRKERMWPDGGIQALRDSGILTVADCDDNYVELPAYNPAFLGTHPYRRDDGLILNRAERRQIAKQTGMRRLSGVSNRHNKDHMHKGFEKVDALTVSTPYLKDIYSRFNSNVQVIRNYLDWEMWDDVPLQYEQERERLRIGYMGVHKYRMGDLELLRPIIRPFLLKHPEVDFVASSDATHDFLDVPKDRRITTGEIAFRTMRLADITAVMDIGLVPLRLNGMNEGKSHLKGMEYNACGIPFIASPTESYKDYWCEEGKNGFLAWRDRDWVEHLESLVGDESLRVEMGKAGRAKAAHHTIQENAGEWESFYLGLLGQTEDYLARMAISHGAIQKRGELADLLRIVRDLEPKVVVEIGSARGGTFWAWCKIAPKDALLVSIDMPHGDFGGAETAKYTMEQFQEYAAHNVEKMKTFVEGEQEPAFLRGNSQSEETRDALAKILAGRPIDFLFIDGDHLYEGVRRDYELYAPLVRDGGVIAFHDIISNPQEKRCRVHKLWDELKGRKAALYDQSTWGFGRWGGIGVLWKEEQRGRRAA